MTRSARSTWNYLTALAFSAISMGVALVVTPILLRRLGEARFGAARAVMDWTGYLTLLELGLGGALGPLFARELARDDPSGTRNMLAAGFRAYLRVALLMVAGGLVLAALITRLIRIDPALHHDLRIATLIAIAPLVFMPLSPLRSLIDANQRGYIVNVFLILQSVVIAACAVIFAKLNLGIAGQLLALSIGTLLLALLLASDALMHYGALLPRQPMRAPEDANRQLWQLNTPTLIMNACGRVGLFTDNIIIGSMLSARAIVPFLMTQRLAQLAQGQLAAIGSATWAGLAQLHARGEHELFRARFLELTRLVTILGLAVLVPIVAYSRAFVALWVGAAQYAGLTLAALAAVNALVVALASLWGWVFSGTGQMARLVPLFATSAFVNLLVSLGITRWFSHYDAHRALWGPVIGTTAAYGLLILPTMPLLLRRHFQVPVQALIAAVAAPVIVAAPYALAVLWIATYHAPARWITLSLHMSVAAIAFLATCWGVLLRPEDRANWKLRWRLATRRRAAVEPSRSG